MASLSGKCDKKTSYVKVISSDKASFVVTVIALFSLNNSTFNLKIQVFCPTSPICQKAVFSRSQLEGLENYTGHRSYPNSRTIMILTPAENTIRSDFNQSKQYNTETSEKLLWFQINTSLNATFKSTLAFGSLLSLKSFLPLFLLSSLSN